MSCVFRIWFPGPDIFLCPQPSSGNLPNCCRTWSLSIVSCESHGSLPGGCRVIELLYGWTWHVSGGKTYFTRNVFPQTKTARQGRGSYFLSIVIPLSSRIVGRQVPLKKLCLGSRSGVIFSCNVSVLAQTLFVRLESKENHGCSTWICLDCTCEGAAFSAPAGARMLAPTTSKSPTTCVGTTTSQSSASAFWRLATWPFIASKSHAVQAGHLQLPRKPTATEGTHNYRGNRRHSEISF